MKNCILFLAFFASCTHEDALIPSVTKENDDADAPALTFSGNSFLPVNLTEYDHALVVRTKSADGSSSNSYKFQFNQDSLLDSNGVRQKYFEQSGWLYTEFPFKSNGSFYAAITPDKSSVIDSLVTLKCSYMLVEHPSAPVEWMEYLVTMIPAKDYYLKNPDYTFLEMPSFSGVILYSDLEGNFLRSENYDRGVITFTTLKKNTTISTKSSGTVIDGGNLNEVYVTGVNLKELNDFYGRLEDYMNNLFSELQQVTDFVEKDDVGGGGGSRNKDKYCTVTEIQNLCLEKERTTTTHSVLKGNSISLMAKESADSLCLFMGWISDGNHWSSKRWIKIENINTDVIIEAKYSSPYHNTECYELFTFLTGNHRLDLIDTLVSLFSYSQELIGFSMLSYFKTDSIAIQYGENTRVNFDYIIRKIYYGTTHTHNIGDCFPSSQDVATFCSSYYVYKELSTYFFDLISRESNNRYNILLMNITDPIKFLKKVRSYIPEGLEERDEKAMFAIEEKVVEHYLKIFGVKSLVLSKETYNKLSVFLNEYGISYKMIAIKIDRNRNISKLFWGDYDPDWGKEMKNELSNKIDPINKCFFERTKN